MRHGKIHYSDYKYITKVDSEVLTEGTYTNVGQGQLKLRRYLIFMWSAMIVIKFEVIEINDICGHPNTTGYKKFDFL